MNEFKTEKFDDKSPQIAVNNDFIRKQKNMQARKNNQQPNFGGSGGALEDESRETITMIEESVEKAKWRRYYIQYALHMVIPIYGTYVFIFVMLVTFKVI